MDFDNHLTLNKNFASNSTVDEQDIRNVKRILNRLAYYTPNPEIGIVDITDAEMFDALKRFQKDKGLKPSGIMRPDDETVQTLNRAIEDQPIAAKYIWYTCQDDKVRSAHAAREGKVFSWIDPPEGGNPGEEYNCRCWAEELRGRKIIEQIYDPPIEPVYPELLILPFMRGGTAIKAAWKLWLEANKRDPEWTLGAHKKPEKWARQMEERDWTPDKIIDAIRKGTKHPAPNKVKPQNTATRYEYDGKFVVRDNKTKEILQISGDDFEPNILEKKP